MWPATSTSVEDAVVVAHRHRRQCSLTTSSLLMILCSPTSIKRPWVNFEAGAAWMREIPLWPLCHAGLKPSDLPLPLSLHQGLALEDPAGVRLLYSRVARLLACRVPDRSFDDVARELSRSRNVTQADLPAEFEAGPNESTATDGSSRSTNGSFGGLSTEWRLKQG